MIASRASFASAVLFAAFFLAAGPLAAQSDLTAPEPLAPVPLAPQGVVGSPSPPPAVAPAPNNMTAEEIGVLDSGNGGLGWDLWAGTDRRVLVGLLGRIPPSITSPTLYDLTRRLLLSRAAAPTASSQDDVTGDSLLSLRLEALAALGDEKGLKQMLAIVPPDAAQQVRQRLGVENALAAGDSQGACATLEQVDEDAYEAFFWQATRIYCQIRAGKTAEAELGIALLRELNRPEDTTFLTLADALLGLETLMPAQIAALDPNRVSALELAMLRDSGADLPPALLTATAPRVRVGLAMLPSADPLSRAQAAEWAITTNRLEPDVLADAYSAFQFTPEQLDDPMSAGFSLPGVEARALYFQAVRQGKVSEVNAAVVMRSLDRAEADGVFFGTAQVMLPLAEVSPSDAGLAWFAATAGRALYALGRYEEATAWLMLAHQEAALSAQAAVAANRLWPYSRLAGVASVMSAAGLEGWRQAQPDPNGPVVARRLSLLRVLFKALGEADDLPWIDLAIGEDQGIEQAVPDATLLYALEDASLNGRTGETVLLTLALLGGGSPGAAHPLALNAALTALVNVGLGLEARALAIEVAVENGI